MPCLRLILCLASPKSSEIRGSEQPAAETGAGGEAGVLREPRLFVLVPSMRRLRASALASRPALHWTLTQPWTRGRLPLRLSRHTPPLARRLLSQAV